MKKIIISLSTLVLAASLSNSFAAVKVATQPEVPYNGSDYIGIIEAADLGVNVAASGGEKKITIMTRADSKHNNDGNNLKGLTLNITADDLPSGYTLANSVGKKIQVIFANANYDIAFVSVVTDEYYDEKKQ